MSFSHEMQEKMNQFAKEQSQHYLDTAEMTYMEQLRRKADQTKRKVGKKLSRFKGSSEQAIDARNDMLLYMSDCMNDLMARGLSEQEAFENAREKLAASDESDIQSELQERFRQYYENRNPADYEAVGLLYGGFSVIGLAIGALSGYIASGGRLEFVNGGWIDTVIGAGAGMLIGAGIGLIGNALIARKGR